MTPGGGRKRLALPVLVAVSLLVVAVAVVSGPRLLNPFVMDGETCRMLLAIRLPRIAVALLMGGALGASGVVLQGVIRNPLADPYVLGISSGASLSAALGMLLPFDALPLQVPALAFAGALATGAMVGMLGSGRGGVLQERLLLAGVGVGFFLSAVLMLVLALCRDDGLRRAFLWMSGDLAAADWGRIPAGAAIVLAGLVLALARGEALNALALGDDIAHGLGFDPGRERRWLFAAAALMTAASVSLGGPVGFIGLVVPHLVRRSVGSVASLLLPLSALVGGALLCSADTVGRCAAAPEEVPAGVVAALIGSPYFLYRLFRERGR